jgi:type I restriction enzyme S subunit
MASVKDMCEWDFDLSACRRISGEDYDELVKNDCRPRKGDILISKDGANLNKYTFLVTEERDLVILSSIAIIRPLTTIEAEYLVAALKSAEVSEAIRRKVSGVAIPRIVLKDFRSVEVLVPPDYVQRAWAEIVGPVHQLCRKLFRANASLAQARDLLLPRLMDGRISV